MVGLASLLLVATLLSVSYSLPDVYYPPNMCYVARWNDGGNVEQIFPLRNDVNSAVAYYAYDTANPASAATPDKLEKPRTATYFLYEYDSVLSLFFIFGSAVGAGGDAGSQTAAVQSEGLAGKGVTIALKDDPADNYEAAFDPATGTGTLSSMWIPDHTDGFVLSNFPRPPTTPNFNGAEFSWSISLRYDSAKTTGLNFFTVMSMQNYWETGARIGTNGASLKSITIDPTLANSLDIAYTQCKCSEDVPLTPTHGFFNSHEVVFGPTGGIGLYRAGSYCTWILDFDLVSGISFFWSEFKMADNPGDIVSFYWDTTVVEPTADVVYPRNTDDRDWGSDIASSQTPFPYSPNSFNSLRTPVTTSSTSKAFVAFSSAPDSPASQPGFQLYYIVIPLLTSLSNTVILPQEVVVISGHNFITSSSQNLKCQWLWSTGPVVTDATYISDTSVSCQTPVKPAGATSQLTVSVSNDGGFYFSNELDLTIDLCRDTVCNSVPAQCHLPGSCDPDTGLCTDPIKCDGKLCDDGNACTQLDTCKAGVCVGKRLVVCTVENDCEEAGECQPATGLCSPTDNKCNGSPCDDGNKCTTDDSCLDGECQGGAAKVCEALDQCHVAGECDAATGDCSNPNKADGSPCDDGNACTQTDTCRAGVCVGSNPKNCAASDSCHVAGVCEPSTGECSNPNKADGASCNDGNACTRTDTCVAGVCTGGNPVVCKASDQCHDAGTCSPTTGKCSDPKKADGAVCDDRDKCTTTDTCRDGKCVGAGQVCCRTHGGRCGTCVSDCRGSHHSVLDLFKQWNRHGRQSGPDDVDTGSSGCSGGKVCCVPRDQSTCRNDNNACRIPDEDD